MRDSCLLSALLKWDENEVINDRERAGKLVESFIYRELASLVDSGGHYEIFHYRDRDKREVDFVVRDTDSGHILDIDAKSGTNVSRDGFRHIRWFRENMTKGAPQHGDSALFRKRCSLSWQWALCRSHGHALGTLRIRLSAFTAAPPAFQFIAETQSFRKMTTMVLPSFSGRGAACHLRKGGIAFAMR